MQLPQSWKNKLAYLLVAGVGLHHGIGLDKGIPELKQRTGVHGSTLGTNFDPIRCRGLSRPAATGTRRKLRRASSKAPGLYLRSHGAVRPKYWRHSPSAPLDAQQPGLAGRATALLSLDRPKTTAATLVLMYSPRPGIGAVGTTLAPRNECRLQARWSSCRLTVGRDVEAPQRTRRREIGKSENVPPLSAAVCTGGDP